MRWTLSRFACLALAGFGMPSGAWADATMTIGAATRLYTNYQPRTTSDFSCPVLKDPSNPTEVFSWTSNGQYAFAKYRGPLNDPQRTLVWSGYSGRWNFTGFPSGYRPWLGNIYKHTDGTLIGFVHIETAVWDDPNCQYRQGIAISTDNGDHWRYCGDVIKSQVEAAGQQNLGGCATVIVGDYFYQYFNEYETGYYRKPAVARALIADVVAAAKTFTVTPWVKYYNGAWNHNALTQAGSSVLPYPSDRYDAHGDAVYCAPLGKYLMVVYEQTGWDYLTFVASDARKGIYLYTSTDGVNWGGKQHVFTPVTGGDACYPFFAGIDGASDDSFVVGSSFKLFVPDRARHELYSIPITVQTTGTPPVVENPELLSNTGFEANTTGWSMNGAGTLSRITTSPASGTASARVTSRTINWAGPSQNFLSDLRDSSPGNYTVSAWMKLGVGSGVGRIQIGLTSGGVTTYPTVSTTILSSGWTFVSGTVNLEWTGILENAVFYVNTETSTADLYFDDCSLRKTAVLSPAAATVFSPEPGDFSEPQAVTLSTATSGASIWYTLDGSTPASGSGILYTNPVSIEVTTTLKAVATRDDMADSDVAIGIYTIELPEPVSDGLVNGSFENGTTGWTVTAPNGGLPACGVLDIQGATDGSFALAFGEANAASNAVLTQSFTTHAGGTYRLTFDYGAFGAANKPQKLRVEVLGDATILVSSEVTALGPGNYLALKTTFSSRSLTFTTPSTNTTIRLTDLTTLANSNSCDGMLDNIEIAEPDPDLVALQQAYVAQEFGMFLHYNMGTYTGEEWASPNRPINTFAPTALDTDQWATAAKSAGMKYGVLTTKHHDGFALWDTSQSTYDVAATSWYAAQAPGQGDIVKRYADSFRAQGLKVGFYYSIWDRSNGIDGTTLTSRQATDYVKAELTELLSNYGPIHVIWTDGWGWKDWHNYVLYSEVYDHIKTLSPTTLLVENNHTAINTDIRTYEQTPLPPEDNLFPAELCATIRADNKWFWSAGADSTKSVEVLMEQRETANARHAAYLLDVTPNRAGMIPESQVAVLAMLQATEDATAPAISAFIYDPSTGVAAISIHGEAGATYQGVACANLPFDETAHVVLLSQANPTTDPGTVSVDRATVVADAEGNVTVQASLGFESRQFLRMERVQ